MAMVVPWRDIKSNSPSPCLKFFKKRQFPNLSSKGDFVVQSVATETYWVGLRLGWVGAALYHPHLYLILSASGPNGDVHILQTIHYKNICRIFGPVVMGATSHMVVNTCNCLERTTLGS